jgi:hypothetical protein
MPQNNPGFDLIVRDGARVVRYVEVKGTRRQAPVFLMTETERRFSAENSNSYTVAMVWNIDLDAQTCTLDRHDGEVMVGAILRPFQYAGRFPLA